MDEENKIESTVEESAVVTEEVEESGAEVIAEAEVSA